MQRDDDQSWLDALAGRQPDEGVSAAGREARAMRAAILARARPEGSVAPQHDPRREAELIGRAARAGLITARARRGSGRLRPWLGGWRTGLAAATLAGLAIAVGVQVGPWDERTPEETYRDPGADVVRLQSADPQALKRAIIAELSAVGVTATGYEALGRQGIDADLPEPLPEDVRRVLERHSIPPPADGVLRIEIVAAETR